MKKILTIITVVMAVMATSCKEAPKETQPAAEVKASEQNPVVALCMADTSRNLCTARALEQVALNGGPRCCKRDSYLSVLTAIDFVKEHLGVEMEKPEVKCSRSQINEQCIGKKCPFSPINN